ncbi:MAG: polysaccharide deacetylase family protein [Propionibacteriaceae bacterium]|nr:polysaccharide deacetylase family protein [Propionibacteriaceae bacterium]
MTVSRRQFTLALSAGLITVGIGACAPAGLSAEPPASSPPPAEPPQSEEPTPSPEPTPEPSPEPTPEPTPQEILDAALQEGSNHSVGATKYAHPAEQVQGWMAEPSTAPEPIVFLTFDDGPNHSTSVQILDILKEHEVPATFFVVGNLVSDAHDVLQREITEGHSIAIHSYSHNYKKLYPSRKANVDTIIDELKRTRSDLRDALGEGYNTSCWRYPGGHMSWQGMAAADEALAAEGVHWVDWNSLTGDAEPENRRPTTVDGMVKMATTPIAEGVKVSVMLAHDSEGKDLTVKSLPKIIEAYKEAGYTFGVIA